jgi:hypothetical protein
MKVRTEYVFPPIPLRQFEWMAYDDDTYCGCGECHCLTGHGATEQEAIADLNEQMEDRRLEEEDAAEEGALTEASGYQFPEYERNGR